MKVRSRNVCYVSIKAIWYYAQRVNDGMALKNGPGWITRWPLDIATLSE